jgi:PAS domain S-box-containing protein
MSADRTDQGTRPAGDPLALLQQRASASPERMELLDEALRHLGTTLEELSVAEEEIRQQNEELMAARVAVEAERLRYQELFEFAPDAYLITDANGVIQEANVAAGHLLRVLPRFLTGKPLGLFVTREGCHLFQSALTWLSREDADQDWEVCLRPRGGDPIDVALKVATVRDGRGRLLGLRWLLRDMTERKRVEALAEADRLKSTLLSVVSHDLRTPLAIIKASTANLRRRLEGARVPDDTAEIVTEIEEEADRLNALVSNLLDLSRLQAGAWEPSREWNDLSDILGTVLARLDDREAARVRVHFPVELPMVYVDGVQIGQVLWNLLDNALKYSPDGSAVEIGAVCEGQSIRVTVSDSGPGVAGAERERIFTPFYRSARPRETGAGVRGSGLGLAICRGLVEAHGGCIWVENRSPTGAMFQFTLSASSAITALPAEEQHGPVVRKCAAS